MITKIQSFKQLPYSIFTAYLLKCEEDASKYDSGYLITTNSPKMILLFVEFIDEINNKSRKMVQL